MGFRERKRRTNLYFRRTTKRRETPKNAGFRLENIKPAALSAFRVGRN
jgi:hypothetical protein